MACIYAIGKGRAAGELLRTMMNMPMPAYNYQTSGCALNTHAPNAAQERMKTACVEAITENQGDADITGAIQWRSATSSDTGKILDVECSVMNSVNRKMKMFICRHLKPIIMD